MPDAVPPVTPDERDGLIVIRFRRFRLWFFFLTYLPAGCVVGQFTRSERVFAVVAGVWMAAFAVCAVVVSLSRCPRCQERFHHRGWRSNTWTQKCLNCGLALRPPEGPT